jgi:hypothetical protein
LVFAQLPHLDELSMSAGHVEWCSDLVSQCRRETAGRCQTLCMTQLLLGGEARHGFVSCTLLGLLELLGCFVQRARQIA